jgi:diacylglycerol kinase
MKKKSFSIRERIKSFSYAFDGIKTLFIEEHNARIHFFLSIVVILLGFFYKIDTYEWVAILLCMGLVFALEAINSSIENLADFCTKEKDPLIKKSKDLAAAAVLIAAIISLFIAGIIFIPKIF